MQAGQHLRAGLVLNLLQSRGWLAGGWARVAPGCVPCADVLVVLYNSRIISVDPPQGLFFVRQALVQQCRSEASGPCRRVRLAAVPHPGPAGGPCLDGRWRSGLGVRAVYE